MLLCLANDPGELLTREFLIQKAWGLGYGSDDALGHAVSEIRHALDDHPENPLFIQTLPRRGYRLAIEPALASKHSSTIVLGASHGPHVSDVSFLENLKQRGVLETALAYLVVGWLLIQVVDVVFAQLHIPAWASTFITALVIAGFPIAVLLSWFLELHHGKAIVHELSPVDARRRRFSRTYLSVISALGAAAILVFTYDQFLGLPEAEPVAGTRDGSAGTELLPVVDNSIAVLRLATFDDDPTTRAFAAGLSEDILDGLARIPGLYVSARGDSWSLPADTSSDVVRRRLRVANYIEGSVRFRDDKLKVVVQLIDSESGYHLFSRSFEIELGKVGDMQRQVTQLVVANLKLAIDESAIEFAAYPSVTTSDDAYVLYMLGREASNRPRTVSSLEEAIMYFNQALAVDPEYPAAHAGLCSAYTSLYVAREDTADIDRAEAACSRALFVAPRLPVVLNTVGRLYWQLGRPGEAEAMYRSALDLNEQDAVALQGLAVIFRREQRFDETELLMQRAIKLQPGNWMAINNLGNLYFGMGQFADAAAEYKKVVYLSPDNFVILGNLASTSLMSGDFSGARDAFMRSLEFEEHSTLVANLGIAHYYLGETNAAIAALQRSIEISPKSAANWIGLGDALRSADRIVEAGEAYGKALELSREQLVVNQNDTESLMLLAWASAITGKADEAASAAALAVALDPADPYSHYYQAIVADHLGDPDMAIEALTRAIEEGYPVAMLAAEPILRELQGDARFETLLAEDRAQGD